MEWGIFSILNDSVYWVKGLVFLFLFFIFYFIYLFIYLFMYCFLGPHPQHVEVPRLGVQLELQLLAYATATAMEDLSHVCDLYHSSQAPPWAFNPLSETGDRTGNLMVPNQICLCCTMMGSPWFWFYVISIQCSDHISVLQSVGWWFIWWIMVEIPP